MNRKFLSLLLLILMGTIIQTASAQFRDQVGQGSQATDIQRELVRRELENQVSTQRGGNVTVRIDRAWSNNLSNRETNIRGTALISVRRGREEAIDFDAVIDTRSNRVTRVDWRPAGQGNQGDYNRPDYNRPSSGQFQSGRYEIQLVATNRMLAVGANRTVVQTDSRNNRNQGWVLEDAGNGLYYIKSADTGEVMTVSGGGSGSSIVLARQRRGSNDQLWEIRSGPDNDYYLISRRGLAMDSPSSARYDGGRMQVYNRNGEANQRFRLNPVSGGRNDDYDRRRQGNPPYDRRPGDYDQRPGYGGSGSMTWSGRVDGTVELIIQGNYVRENNIDGQAVYNSRSRFSSQLPNANVRVSVSKLRGRGRVEIIEQPSSNNRFSAIIRIRDEQGGADDYEIQVNWN